MISDDQVTLQSTCPFIRKSIKKMSTAFLHVIVVYTLSLYHFRPNYFFLLQVIHDFEYLVTFYMCLTLKNSRREDGRADKHIN